MEIGYSENIPLMQTRSSARCLIDTFICVATDCHQSNDGYKQSVSSILSGVTLIQACFDHSVYRNKAKKQHVTMWFHALPDEMNADNRYQADEKFLVLPCQGYRS
jgi:hypothetical protein